MNIESKIREELFALQDLEYKSFQARLMPTVEPESIIGIRTPILRKYAKSLAKTVGADEFLSILPHKYYEENNLHAFLIEAVKDYETAVSLVDEFLPYVDNWATCDSMSPKVFHKHTDELLQKINEWILSDKVYTVRYGIGMLMKYFLDEKFDESYLKLVAGIKSEEYYINMMIAWYFATALAKQYKSAISFIEEKKLSVWVHNKSIQKAIESFRISSEHKAYLRTLRLNHRRQTKPII